MLLGNRNMSKYNLKRLDSIEILIPKKSKVNDLVLDKYKYLINTVPSPEMERCNDYPKGE